MYLWKATEKKTLPLDDFLPILESSMVAFCIFAVLGNPQLASLCLWKTIFEWQNLQFFWWEVNLWGLRAFILQKVQTLLLRYRKKSSATHHTALAKKTLLYYSCQPEIDYLTQQPKERCSGPLSAMASFLK